MTNEQREAVERLEKRIKDNEDYKITQVWLTDDVVAMQTVVSLIKEQQEEIEGLKDKEVLIKRYFNKCDLIKQKDKQIDLMADFIGQDMRCIRPEIKCNKMTHDCKDCVKQYFADLVEKES